MKKSILALVVILAFSLAAVAQSSYGGSSSQSQSSAQPSSSTQSNTSSGQSSDMDKTKTSTGKEKGITGCLEQGTSPGSYLIKDKKHPEGVQVSYSGSEDLSKHVGHKVHATGTMSGDTLNATNVKHISETCNMGGGAASTGHHHGSEAGASNPSSTDTGTKPDSGTQQPPK